MSLTEKQELALKKMLLYCLDYTDIEFSDIHRNIKELFYKCWKCKKINIQDDKQCRICGSERQIK